MGTDWLIKIRCWKGMEKGKNEEDHIKECLKCPYVIWETPKGVAGLFRTMCGVRVGNVYRSAELDDIGQKLTGIAQFTKEQSSPSFKKDVLHRIKNYSQMTGWSLEGFSHKETIERLDMLIEFCKRVEQKGLEIHAWA